MSPRPHPAGTATTTAANADSRSTRTAPTTRVGRVGHGLPGLAIALAVAVVATLAGVEMPVVGGPVFGIVLGVLVATVLRP
ncbi:MAG: hypothetical protein QOG20_2936, partial [Pseudonocardiales bacterium]|nr:hypothetical protein [Pseudonocardiales bacterium]